jgi:hypothetical protein
MKTCHAIILTTLLCVALKPGLVSAGALDRGPMPERYNPVAQEMLRIPGVVGLYEREALSLLQQAGLSPDIEYIRKEKTDFAGREGTVVAQDPGAGGVAMLGSIVAVTIYLPPGYQESADVGAPNGDPGGVPWDEEPTYAEPIAEPYPEADPPQWGEQSLPDSGGWAPVPAAPAAPAGPAQPGPYPEQPQGGVVAPQAQTPAVEMPAPQSGAAGEPQEEASTDSGASQQTSADGPPTYGATPVLPGATVQTPQIEWQVKPWQTEAWATVYDGGRNDSGVWTHLRGEIAGHYMRSVMDGNAAIGNAPTGPNQSNPAGGTAGTYAVVVQTPIGELPCNRNAISHSDAWMRMGFFYKCMDAFPLEGHYFSSWNDGRAGLPPRQGKRTGTIVSATHKRFLSFMPPSGANTLTLKIKKLGGKGRATVMGAIGDWGHFWSPWTCEFPRGKKSKGQVCSFTFQEVRGRFVGVQITGHSTTDRFQYEISRP